MTMALTVYIARLILLMLFTNMGIRCKQISNHFKILACSGFNAENILKATTVHESQQKTIMKCAISCNKNLQCDYAIFRHSLQRCFHVSNTQHTISQNALSPEADKDCSILRRKGIIICQNGGTLLNYTCRCPPDWIGQECQLPNAQNCRGGSWRNITTDEFGILTSSGLQIKLILHASDTTKVFVIQTFIRYGSYFTVQAHNYLAMESLNFKIPLSREYKLYSKQVNSIDNIEVGMSGNVKQTKTPNPDFHIAILDPIDDQRLFYREKSYGTIDQLMDGLSKGYRLLRREPSLVGFDSDSGDAYFVSITQEVGMSKTALLNPPYHYSVKRTLQNKRMDVGRWRISNGYFMSQSLRTGITGWELDRCWVKIDPILENDLFTNVLKEIILEGRDVRVVLGKTMSSDVSMLTVTSRDIIATLASYLTPLDGKNPLTVNSRIRFLIISRYKFMSQCEKAFEGSTVFGTISMIYTGTLEWFAHTRPTNKILKVTETGKVVHGSIIEVYNTAVKGLNNIRVCVELSAGSLWSCFGTNAVHADNREKIVVLQSLQVVGAAIHDNGTFAGIKDKNCEHYVMLVSTKGTVQKARYNPGTPYSENDVFDVAFRSISWFSEK